MIRLHAPAPKPLQEVGGGRGSAWRWIIRPQESLVLYKSLNTLWFRSSGLGFSIPGPCQCRGHLLLFADLLPHDEGNFEQCCQLLAKLSGQSGGKIRPLRKPILALTKFYFFKAFGLLDFLLFVSTCPGKKYNISIFLWFHRNRGKICTEPAKIRPQHCLAALFSSFYSALFRLCGRTIGQLATLILKNSPHCCQARAQISGHSTK